jgi:N-acetylmuramoyl-L-alanine amidase
MLAAQARPAQDSSPAAPDQPAEPAPAAKPLTLHRTAPAPAKSSGASSEQQQPSQPLPSKAAASQQKQSAPPSIATVPMNRTVIVLDPAHGGPDGGSRIGDSIQEKDVTLALAFKLRSLLTARGLTVILTRDSDTVTAPNPAAGALTLDDRAGIANHARAVACLLLHATASGNGAHLYSSELAATSGEPAVTPWLSAQAPWVTQSRALEGNIGAALTRAEVPLVMGHASVRPVDSLSCPALVIELAPRTDDPASVNDDLYQQRVAEAIAGALVFWQNQAVAPTRLPVVTAASPVRRSTTAEAQQP